MLTFDQLVQPMDQAGWLAFNLLALQGVSPVQQVPAQDTNQLVGTGEVSVQGPAQQASQVVILITSTGDVPFSGDSNPAAAFQYSLDGGVTFNPPAAPVSMSSLGPGATYVIPVVNITISFANGLYTPPGGCFQAGESYQFKTNTPTFPVTNWSDVSPGNSLLQVDSLALASLDLNRAFATAGGFTQSWINPPLVNGVPTPPPDGWADLLAQNQYNRQRIQAIATQGIGVLTCAATAGPYPITPGTQYAVSTQGQVFTNIGAIVGGSFTNATQTLASSGSLAVVWQALVAGAGANNVSSYPGASAAVPGGNYLLTLQTPMPGVTLANLLQSNPLVSHAGAGSGVVTATAGTGGPSGEATVLIRITVAGTVGSSMFQVSMDGGDSWSSPTATASSYALSALNMVLGFSGTFTAGDTYGFGTAWITQYGNDQQSSRNLIIACQDQWAELSPAGPQGVYKNWALAASSEVADCVVNPDQVVPGQVDLTLIGANNAPVSSAAIAAVTAYILPRLPQTVSISVGTVSTLNVQVGTSGGYIVVANQYRTTAPKQIAAVLAMYQDEVAPQGTVYLSEVEALIQGVPGVIEITPNALTLNSAKADVQLGPNQTPVIIPPTSSSYQFV